MTASSDQDDGLRRAFFAGAQRADPEGECPSPEVLWAAAAGELPAEERRALIGHTAGCAACAEDFRVVAAMVRAMPAQAPPAPAAGGGVVVAGPWTARPGSRWLAGSLAAVFLLAAIFAVVLGRLPFDPPPEIYRGAAEEVVSLLGPAPKLAAGAASLRWQGPPGARYELTVTTADLRLVAEATDLAEPAYTLPVEQLQPFAAGDRFNWRVVAILPDGRRISSPTFSFELE
jgi:hypothetical protein